MPGSPACPSPGRGEAARRLAGAGRGRGDATAERAGGDRHRAREVAEGVADRRLARGVGHRRAGIECRRTAGDLPQHGLAGHRLAGAIEQHHDHGGRRARPREPALPVARNDGERRRVDRGGELHLQQRVVGARRGHDHRIEPEADAGDGDAGEAGAVGHGAAGAQRGAAARGPEDRDAGIGQGVVGGAHDQRRRQRIALRRALPVAADDRQRAQFHRVDGEHLLRRGFVGACDEDRDRTGERADIDERLRQAGAVARGLHARQRRRARHDLPDERHAGLGRAVERRAHDQRRGGGGVDPRRLAVAGNLDQPGDIDADGERRDGRCVVGAGRGDRHRPRAGADAEHAYGRLPFEAGDRARVRQRRAAGGGPADRDAGGRTPARHRQHTERLRQRIVRQRALAVAGNGDEPVARRVGATVGVGDRQQRQRTRRRRATDHEAGVPVIVADRRGGRRDHDEPVRRHAAVRAAAGGVDG